MIDKLCWWGARDLLLLKAKQKFISHWTCFRCEAAPTGFTFEACCTNGPVSAVTERMFLSADVLSSLTGTPPQVQINLYRKKNPRTSSLSASIDHWIIKRMTSYPSSQRQPRLDSIFDSWPILTADIDPIQPLFILSAPFASEQISHISPDPPLSSPALPFSEMPFETGVEIFIHYHNPLVMSPEYIAILNHACFIITGHTLKT